MGDGGSHSQMFARSTHVMLPAPRLNKKNFRPPAAAPQGSCLQRNMLRVLSFRLFFSALRKGHPAYRNEVRVRAGCLSTCLQWRRAQSILHTGRRHMARLPKATSNILEPRSYTCWLSAACSRAEATNYACAPRPTSATDSSTLRLHHRLTSLVPRTRNVASYCLRPLAVAQAPHALPVHSLSWGGAACFQIRQIRSNQLLP